MDIKAFRVISLIRKNIEIRFQGLPHAHSSLIKSLLNYADPQTGMIEGLSCRDLCLLLTVDPACGRKGSGIPKIETIRSYLRTIASNFPHDFKVVSAGQKLKLQFPTLPALFENYFGLNNLYGDESSYQSLEESQSVTGINQDFCLDEIAHFHEECESKAHITITNKQTNNYNNQQSENKKQPISLDFFPNEKTILIAKQKGLLKVTDPQEIQAFIDHNLEKQTRWADYNPIFIKWLERGEEYQKRQQKMTNRGLRSKSDERCFKTKKFQSREQMLRKIVEANRESLNTREYESILQTCGFTLDEAIVDLWTTVPEQIWDERRWNMVGCVEGLDSKSTGGGDYAFNLIQQ
jgi:hypothetical protein